MKRAVLACLAVAALYGAMAAHAAAATSCAVAEHLAQADVALPHVAAAIKDERLAIVVIGSASSMLGPQAGPGAAYPARLQQALAARLPRVSIRLSVDAQPRRTAATMADELDRLLKADRPALVVWQTGTVDAMRGVDPEEFRATLDDGVDRLHTAGADVILVNMQYSPRTESMLSIEAYLERMRVVAMQHEVPLFDRFAIMKQWSELGSFDFTAPTREFAQATRVHECFGQLLADMIVEAVSPARLQSKERN